MEHSFYMQHMLLRYGRQLTTARRLARYRRLMGETGEQDGEEASALRRKHLVERIATEIVDNLFITGSENPVVDSIRERLNADVGEPINFRYPPGELSIQVYREGPSGPQQVSPTEKNAIMEQVWTITRETVDATML